MHILTAKVHEFRGLVTKRKVKCSMWWNVVGSSEITECYMFYFRFFIVLLSSQDSELLWNHAPWLLERNQEIAVKVN